MRRTLALTVCAVGLCAPPLAARADCHIALESGADGGAQVLTLEEAAGLLRIEQDDLAHAARHGQVPGRQILGVWRFSKAALLVWLAGVDDPADCLDHVAASAVPHVPRPKPVFEEEALREREVSQDELARVAGTGPGARNAPPLAQTSEAASGEEAEASDAPDETERYGEAPEVDTARELALREETVLGRRGAAQVETELTYNRQERPVLVVPAIGEQEVETSTVALTGRYAITERFQLEAGGALSYRSSGPNLGLQELAGGQDDASFGDVALGARYQLRREQTLWPAIFLSADGGIPTDGTDAYSLAGELALTKRFDPTTLFGSAGYRHTFNANERGAVPDDFVSTTLGFVFAMNDRIAFGTAFQGTFVLESQAQGVELRSDERYDLSLSLPFVVSENLSLVPSVSLGLDDSLGNRFGLGLSVISSFSAPVLF